jgi:hypothetical protein
MFIISCIVSVGDWAAAFGTEAKPEKVYPMSPTTNSVAHIVFLYESIIARKWLEKVYKESSRIGREISI